MKTTSFFLAFLICSLSLAAQSNKLDPGIILPNDIYWNYKDQLKSNAIPITIKLKEQGTEIFNYEYVTGKADHYYEKKAYRTAASLYSIAFAKNNEQGWAQHRMRAACSYAMLKNADSAFKQLFVIARTQKYFDLSGIKTEPQLLSLQKDSRWKLLIAIIKKNEK